VTILSPRRDSESRGLLLDTGGGRKTPMVLPRRSRASRRAGSSNNVDVSATSISAACCKFNSEKSRPRHPRVKTARLPLPPLQRAPPALAAAATARSHFRPNSNQPPLRPETESLPLLASVPRFGIHVNSPRSSRSPTRAFFLHHPLLPPPNRPRRKHTRLRADEYYGATRPPADLTQATTNLSKKLSVSSAPRLGLAAWPKSLLPGSGAKRAYCGGASEAPSSGK